MTIALRDYQQEAIEAIIREAKEGVNRQLCTLPTGSGKTVIMGALARQINKKTLILAHREELISQAVDKFRLVWPEASVGICMGERDEIDQQVVVGSVQSCSRPKRLERLKEQGFELLLIDEAHHSTSDSYQNIINACGFSKSANKLLVGVTATPSRSDKQPLGETFDKITFNRSISTMIRSGYLSPVVGRKIITNFALERIRTQNGDFSISELSEAVNTPERNKFIVDKFKAYAAGRKGLAFCCDVQHCRDLAEAFNKEGVICGAVWGDMPAIDRKQALEDLKSGRIQIATSCGVLTEGFDEPSIEAVIMARPTKSTSLYIQCVGRGLRLWPGKENCIVLDFTDRSHNLDSIMSLNKAVPEAVIVKEKGEEVKREEVDKTPKFEHFDECDQEFDILGTTRFIWVPVDDEEWSLQDDERHEIVMSPSAGGYIAVLYSPNYPSQPIVNDPLPFEYCSGVCEDYARRNLKIAFADMKAPWMIHNSPPTQGQRDYLEKHDAFKEDMSKGQAALEIRKIVGMKNKQRRLMCNDPITDKQRYYLNSCGVDTASMSKLAAMQAIAKLKQKVG